MPVGPALDDPATQAALRRYRRHGWWITLTGAALLVAFVLLANSQSQHAKWLLEHGARVPGQITSVSYGAHGGSFKVEYSADGRDRTGTINLTTSSGSYYTGETVTVIYDPKHPTDIRTPSEKNEPRGTVLLMVIALLVGLMVSVGGAVTLVRARRWRRLLVSSPWAGYRARYLRAKRGRLRQLNPGIELQPLSSTDGAPLVLRLASTSRWRGERMARHDGETVWLAGDPHGKLVVCVPTTRELFGAGPPNKKTVGAYRQAASQPPPGRDSQEVRKGRHRVLLLLPVQWILGSVVLIAGLRGDRLGFILAGSYTLALLVTAATLRRAWRKHDQQSLNAASPPSAPSPNRRSV